jgi:oxaloacetate decarboxylase alpha subunit
MSHVEFIDQTLRDGQQSLWGMRMRAGQALPIAPTLDRAGYEVVDLVGSSMFEIMVRDFAEYPWAGLDLMRAAMPRSRLRAGLRNTGIVSMSVTPDALMDLWVDLLCRHGIGSFWIYDVLHYNVDKTHRLGAVAKQHGAEVVAALMYTLSPVHTDAFYAERAERLGGSPHVDRLILYDTAGILTPERARTLIPAVQARSGGKPIEIHSHNVLGIAPLTYLEAIGLGVTGVHTCSAPLANGASLPSIEMMLRNVETASHTHRIDRSTLAPVAKHFEDQARACGYALGRSNEYDLWVFEHQVPGGMTGTLKNQLAQHRMPERLDEVLREISVVRRELGYPGMATPFSQLVGVQSVMNVVSGERYAVVPDEVIGYVLGWYGQPIATIDPNVLDRILSRPRARELAAQPRPQPSLADLRHEFGKVDDEELILRYLIARPFIEKMKASGPVPTEHPRLASPELEAARKLLAAARGAYVELSRPGLHMTLTRT